jgi:hypothetical protein
MGTLIQDFVAPDSLNWALTHVLRFGENDVLPTSFEFEAYKAQWPEILTHLSKINLSEREVEASLKLLAPKGKWGYRAVTLLDPFDHLLYTAMIYEIAERVENFRITKDKKIACAYRLEIDPQGQFFQRNSGWPDFHERSDSLSAGACKVVVVADISDFYNQTSHHRIQNALSSAGVKEERANNVENFLGNLSSRHHSRGIPVGPAASILLAEACLADVDNFLIRKGYVHTRYVDDFRIFCESQDKAVSALHDLSQYLHTAHRLSFQTNKTRVLPVEEFRTEELVDPEQLALEAQQSKIHDLFSQIEFSPYETPDDFELDESTEADLLRDALGELFKALVSRPALHVGVARYILRRATSLKTRTILTDVLNNLELLFPVLRDVIKYLIHAYDRKCPEQVGTALVRLLTNSPYRQLPYVQHWVLSAFADVPAFCEPNTAIRLSENSDSQIRDRASALIAKGYKLVDWVRARKENWQNSSPSGQRAIIWAAPILPRDERSHWLKGIANYPVLSTAMIAKAVLSGIGKV